MLPHGLRVLPILAKKAQQQEREVPGYALATVREPTQWTLALAQLALVFQRTPAHGIVPPY